MPLKSRITLIVVAAVAALWLVFAAGLWQRDAQLTQRYHGSLLQAQAIAWKKLQSDALASLAEASERALAQPALKSAWSAQDHAGAGAQLRAALQGRGGWRADLFDDNRQLVYSTSTAVRAEPLIDAAWIAQALGTQDSVAGISQVSRDRYYWVLARRFGDAAHPGVLAVALDAASALPELAQTVGADSYLLNLRGREVAGAPRGLLPQPLDLALRQANAAELETNDAHRRLALVHPLAGPDRRQVGALVSVHDLHAQLEADRLNVGVAVAGGLLLVLGLAFAVFTYLRRAMLPLHRSVGVLEALSKGNLDAALDDADEAQPDESGQIARGVAALRLEMLNLQMLRDERTRIREQQENLIRRQLKALAENLDAESRAEILHALEPEMRTNALRSGGNELAELASILGRLSGLVTTQQNRLVGLLQDLRAAMEQQSLLVSLKQELEIARSMQLSILPRTAPSTNAAQVEALMLPAREVGGDFYDYFLVDDRRLAVVVADVSGKGVPAAFFMAISRTLLKTNALYLRHPGLTIARLNDQLCAENEQMMFVTVFYAVLDLTSGQLEYVNAGHNPPVLRERSGRVRLLPKGMNPALAVMDDLRYTEGHVQLARGETLLLYTDGVTEATNPANQMFGEAALLDVVQRHEGSTGLPEAVLEAVRAFENGAAQADDITCVALRYRGGA